MMEGILRAVITGAVTGYAIGGVIWLVGLAIAEYIRLHFAYRALRIRYDRVRAQANKAQTPPPV